MPDYMCGNRRWICLCEPSGGPWCTSSIYILYFYKDDSSTNNQSPKQEAAGTENQHHNRKKTSRLSPTKSGSYTERGGRRNYKPQTQGKQIVKHYSKFYYGRIENHHPTNKELE